MKTKNELRDAVRESYSLIAETANNTSTDCCTPKSGSSCCSTSTDFDLRSLQVGYSELDLNKVPEGANLGLGCGNPQAIAAIKAGEVVLDLGSGAGFDAFLAAHQVKDEGLVIGVDMTATMITKARKNAEKVEAKNVEFRLGEIEHLPVADGVVDVIISNCVINLSPEKQKVFNEAYRVLKPGGRLAISDVVAFSGLSDKLKSDMALYSNCISGASPIYEIESMLKIAGFKNISIKPKEGSDEIIKSWDIDEKIVLEITSASIEAVKP